MRPNDFLGAVLAAVNSDSSAGTDWQTIIRNGGGGIRSHS